MTARKCDRYALLVTGSRGWTDRNTIRERLLGHYPVTATSSVLLHGGADGVDTLAAALMAEFFHYWYVEETPYFGWLGKFGGHVRNRFLIQKLKCYRDAGYIARVEAFSLGTPGTENCIQQALGFGFEVHVTTPEKTELRKP